MQIFLSIFKKQPVGFEEVLLPSLSFPSLVFLGSSSAARGYTFAELSAEPPSVSPAPSASSLPLFCLSPAAPVSSA